MTSATADPTLSTLGRLLRKPPIACSPQDGVREAIQIMRAQSIGSMIVVDPAQVPVGILTLRDVADRVVLEPGALDGPIARVMTPDPVTLGRDETAYQAALTMIRHGVRHIVVVDGGRLAGIVSERDLFGMQSSGVRHLSTAITGAQDLDAVEGFGREICELARAMHAQGVAVGALTAFIASLNDLLTERIVELEFDDADLGGARMCWILMGSEGRCEQTLVTDQDNGIVFTPGPGQSVEEARTRILPVARHVNQALGRAGYQLCPGEIMAGNARWCLSFDEWRELFGRWIDSGSPEALLHGSIFFDLRPLYGHTVLARDLRAWMLGHAARNRRFLHQMAANALRNRPPLGLLRDFNTAEDGRIDLKLNGATPFVDAARIFCLACAIDETNTERRLRAAAGSLKLPVHEAEAWIAAFYCLQGQRLRVQAESLQQTRPAGNRIDPATLHDFDRGVLKLAFQQAKSLQSRLALDYGA
jgi:CBS domain-containing protein